MLSLSEIHIFPVKSLRGALMPAAQMQACGLDADRRWLVTDAGGQFLTQRDHPRMALIQAETLPGGLRLTAQGAAPLTIAEPDGPTHMVKIWRDQVEARDAGDAAAALLTAQLGLPCRLVQLARANARPLRPEYNRGGEHVSFADGFPVLITTAASLADLNARLANPIAMLRFRPNLVIAGAAPWAEDGWRRLRIGPPGGGVVLRIDKPCDRCVMTTIDPETGLRPNPVEPIRTLGRFRRDRRGGVMFGQNAVPETTGLLRVGDAVEILESGPPNVQLAG